MLCLLLWRSKLREAHLWASGVGDLHEAGGADVHPPAAALLLVAHHDVALQHVHAPALGRQQHGRRGLALDNHPDAARRVQVACGDRACSYMQHGALSAALGRAAGGSRQAADSTLHVASALRPSDGGMVQLATPTRCLRAGTQPSERVAPAAHPTRSAAVCSSSMSAASCSPTRGVALTSTSCCCSAVTCGERSADCCSAACCTLLQHGGQLARQQLPIQHHRIRKSLSDRRVAAARAPARLPLGPRARAVKSAP